MVLKCVGITGATGMLGRHLRSVFSDAGVKVAAVSRSDSGEYSSKAWNLADWLSFEKLDELFFGVEVLVHAGAMVPAGGPVDDGLMFSVNVRASANLGEWALARNIPMVYISGAIVYADTSASLIPEDAPTGPNGVGGFYGFSKLLAEDVLLRFRQRGLNLAIVRPSSIYGFGLGQNKMMISFLRKAAANGILEITQPVQDRVDLVHALDVATAVRNIISRECWTTFNISSGQSLSIKDIADCCVSVCKNGEVVVVGEECLHRERVDRYSLSTLRAKNLLGWSPTIDFAEGLLMTKFGNTRGIQSS